MNAISVFCLVTNNMIM